MKAITLHQPWATLIADGAKTIETRSWRPPQTLIGQRIVIHAGKRLVANHWSVADVDAIANEYFVQVERVRRHLDTD